MTSPENLKGSTQLFARIRLHGLTNTSNGISCPIDLERQLSFPMPANTTDHRINDHDKDLSSRLLGPTYDIEARVCFQTPLVQDSAEEEWPASVNLSRYALGHGRAGIVYPLEILSLRPSQTTETSTHPERSLEPPSLPPLCIKVATPGHARNHAREAWFYEQFEERGLIGLVIPHCYGVFHISKIPDDITINIPGYDYYGNASKSIFKGSKFYTACLPEEFYDHENNKLNPNTLSFLDDTKNSYAKSEWKEFRETPEVTTMTVLVMDLLGPPITLEEFEKDWEGEINDIWDHLAPLDIVHEDVRFPNVLRVPPHLQVPCPMHPNAGPGHKWNLTDWEHATILCIDLQNRLGVWDQRLNLCSYYFRVGGKLGLWRNWKDYFKVIEETEELVYLGPGLHEDQMSNFGH